MNTTPSHIDALVYTAVFGNAEERARASYEIWQTAHDGGIFCASIHELYMARAAGKIEKKFTVPAVNVRGMTYDVARAIFAAARSREVGAFIFEIARSEMSYTEQAPLEYATVVLAAALREEFAGPVFIQGDHFQAKAASMGIPQDGEIVAIQKLTREALQAGFYNIDIDMSTLVDLDAPSVDLEQAPNILHSLEMLRFIRACEPAGITTSVGVEIGHIGGKNSTVADFTAFMSGFMQGLSSELASVSKISVATGTSHGGVVQADGSLAPVALDFSILRDISALARQEYGIGGAVQHGASTLPDSEFDMFPTVDTLEVHLATGIQNMIFDDVNFPRELLQEIYQWIDREKQSERKNGQTDEQFHYELRKKAWGPFKRQCWEIPESSKAQLRQLVTDRFVFLFDKLGVDQTKTVVAEHITQVVVSKTPADFQVKSEAKNADVQGLSD